MMNYKALKAEIALPTYSGMSNPEILAALIILDKPRNKASLTRAEILEVCEPTALMALTGEKAIRVWGILGMDSVDPFGIAANVFIDAFGSPSDTITALATLRVETLSRADILGLGRVTTSDIETARA